MSFRRPETTRTPPHYSPMLAFFKHALLRVGLPIAATLLCLYAAWLGGTRRERYVKQVADEWHAIRMKAQNGEQGRTSEALRRARERERQRTLP